MSFKAKALLGHTVYIVGLRFLLERLHFVEDVCQS